MKFIFGLSAILFLTLSSCNKEKKTNSTAENVSEKSKVLPDLFKVDSVHVQDSTRLSKVVTSNFSSTVLVFPNISDKTLLDSIYATENIRLKEYSKNNLLSELNGKKDQFIEDNKTNLKDYAPTSAQSWGQNSHMKLFDKIDDFMIIQYSADGYGGGAHGYYNEIYKVFDTEKKQTLQLTSIIKNPENKIWTKILMDHFLKNDLRVGQAGMLLVKEIPLNSNFYFDRKNLYFLYNQYEITAYAAGPVLIKVPFTDVKPLLTSEFKASLKL